MKIKEGKKAIQSKINMCNMCTKKGTYKETRNTKYYKELRGMIQLCKALDINIKVNMTNEYMLFIEEFEK